MAAKVGFIETTSAKLKSLPLVNGRFTFVTDTGALYRDTASARNLVSGDMVVFATDSVLNIVTTGARVAITVNSSGDSLSFNTVL